jgi:cation diffusion facilitator CzcD-associated flavoprotein CzcO
MDTELLVIGAGPYALSAAALARDSGIGTTVLGHPMAFWRDNMPAGMFLRSGPDWHLDAAGVHTLEAYLEERGIATADVDPMPIDVFLDYAEWFRAAKGVEPRADLVAGLARANGGYEATLESGERIVADAVVCAPGIRHFTNLPAWAAEVPPERAAHTCDLVSFDSIAGERVLIVGGRQSAYEWAALMTEHGAASVDIVHRHDVPRFEPVSWRFIDPHVERTLEVPGYWRRLPPAEQERITRRFWEVGRLTLEAWLTPRLGSPGIRRRPGCEVAGVTALPADAGLAVRLSDSDSIEVDRVVFASGYRAQLQRVPYLAPLIREIDVSDGFPVLDESLQTNLPALYVTGFSATRDFGPFFGFVKAAPASATLIVRDLLSSPAR